MDASEQAFLDGTHPALVGGAPSSTSQAHAPSLSPSHSRTNSNESANSSSSADPSAPRFSAYDPDGVNNEGVAPANRRAKNGGASNTGPKGVIADWAASRRQSTVAAQHGATLGGLVKLSDNTKQPLSLISLAASLEGEEREEREREEEARAKESYRERRMNELRGSGERNASSRVFGHLREIGIDQFLSAIEDVDDIAVVLHLYEPAFEDCDILNHHLASIARAYPHTKFLRTLAAEVDFATNIEEETLPTILVYRNGELETTLVGINREWGNGTRQEILDILIKHKTLSATPTIPFSNGGNTLASRDYSDEE